MSKAQIAAHIATKFEMTKKAGALVLEEIAKLAYREAKKGFTLPGIGKLVVVKRKARMGRNPQTGEPIVITARRVLNFKASQLLKQALNEGLLDPSWTQGPGSSPNGQATDARRPTPGLDSNAGGGERGGR